MKNPKQKEKKHNEGCIYSVYTEWSLTAGKL